MDYQQINMFSSIDQARLINLMVVAKIKKGERLNTTSHYYAPSQNGYTQSMSRYLSGESRSQTIASLTQLINSVMNIKALKDDEDIKYVINLLLDVEKGICNLIYTYTNDVTTVSALTLILNTVERFIKTHGVPIQLEKFKIQRYYDENETIDTDDEPDIITEDVNV